MDDLIKTVPLDNYRDAISYIFVFNKFDLLQYIPINNEIKLQVHRAYRMTKTIHQDITICQEYIRNLEVPNILELYPTIDNLYNKINECVKKDNLDEIIKTIKFEEYLIIFRYIFDKQKYELLEYIPCFFYNKLHVSRMYRCYIYHNRNKTGISNVYLKNVNYENMLDFFYHIQYLYNRDYKYIKNLDKNTDFEKIGLTEDIYLVWFRGKILNNSLLDYVHQNYQNDFQEMLETKHHKKKFINYLELNGIKQNTYTDMPDKMYIYTKNIEYIISYKKQVIALPLYKHSTVLFHNFLRKYFDNKMDKSILMQGIVITDKTFEDIINIYYLEYDNIYTGSAYIMNSSIYFQNNNPYPETDYIYCYKDKELIDVTNYRELIKEVQKNTKHGFWWYITIENIYFKYGEMCLLFIEYIIKDIIIQIDSNSELIPFFYNYYGVDFIKAVLHNYI